MPPETLAAVLDAVERAWGFAPDIEITLEAKPSSVEAARFVDIAAAGVNRVSLGLQALDDDALRFLGRAHRSEEHTSELQSLMRISYAVFRLHKKRHSLTSDAVGTPVPRDHTHTLLNSHH